MDKLELASVVVSMVGLLLTALLAGREYRRKASLQAMRALHEAQLRLCEEVANSAASLVGAHNQEELADRIDTFSVLKHGRGLALLDRQLLDAMVELYNEAICFELKTDGDFRFQLRMSLGAAAFTVVHECRNMLSRIFEREAGGGLALLRTDYAMQWCQARELGEHPSEGIAKQSIVPDTQALLPPASATRRDCDQQQEFIAAATDEAEPKKSGYPVVLDHWGDQRPTKGLKRTPKGAA